MQTPAVPFIAPSSPAPRKEESSAQPTSDDGDFGAALSAQSQKDRPDSSDEAQNKADAEPSRSNSDTKTAESNEAQASASKNKDEDASATSSQKTSQESGQKEKSSQESKNHASNGKSSKRRNPKQTANSATPAAKENASGTKASAAEHVKKASQQTTKAATSSTEPGAKQGKNAASNSDVQQATRKAQGNAKSQTHTSGQIQDARAQTEGAKTQNARHAQSAKQNATSSTPAQHGAKKKAAAHTNATSSSPGATKRTPTTEHRARGKAGQPDANTHAKKSHTKAAHAGHQAKSSQRTAGTTPASDARAKGTGTKQPPVHTAAGDGSSKNNASTTGQHARHGARGRQQRSQHAASQAHPNPPGHQPTDPRANATAQRVNNPASFANWDKAPTDFKFDAESFRDKIAHVTAEGRGTTARTSATSGNARLPSFVSHSRGLGWLRAAARAPSYTQGNDGWQKLEMQLKRGDGLMTLMTRQGKDHMTISVGFSDARMRAQAAASAAQLQETLQSQYDTNIDFSLMGDGTNDAHQQAQSEQARRTRDAGAPTVEAVTPEVEHAASTHRALAAGAQHEWIG